jgi:hypothetical protein
MKDPSLGSRSQDGFRDKECSGTTLMRPWAEQ